MSKRWSYKIVEVKPHFFGPRPAAVAEALQPARRAGLETGFGGAGGNARLALPEEGRPVSGAAAPVATGFDQPPGKEDARCRI